MTLMISRTKNRVASKYISHWRCIAWCGVVLAGQQAIGQENPMKVTIGQLTSSQAADNFSRQQESIVVFKPQEATQKPEADIAVPGITSNRPSRSPVVEPAIESQREKIVLPALSVPNTSPRLSPGVLPDDMVSGRLPEPIALPFGSDRFGYSASHWKTWNAPVYCQQPTYFEDTMLEDHGHERFPCLQPVVSGVRFYSTAAFLPYLSYVNPPLQNSYSAGSYRPGAAAPCLRQRAPYDKAALRFQLLTTGATVFVAQP
jgi:hypothetical protein